MLIERETLAGGVGDGEPDDELADEGELDEDWALTVTRKANPRRTAARKTGWRRPTMAMGERGSHLGQSGQEVNRRKEW